MQAAVELRIRRRVADSLGVDEGELTPDVSLTDDLAADSLDLVELAMELEEELGIALPAALLDRVRTYGELVSATLALACGRRAPAPDIAAVPTLVRATIHAADGGHGVMERSGGLTPYTVTTIADDARRAGPGACLEVLVPGHPSAEQLAEVESRFAWLREKGITVRVRRGDGERRPRSLGAYRRERAA